MSELSLLDALPLGVSLELIKTHGIAVDIFDPHSITLGRDQGWTDALNRHVLAKQQVIAKEPGRNNEVAKAQRSVARKTSLRLKYTQDDNWNIYSVFIFSRGSQRISAELEIHGQRLHPRNRTGAEHEIKFDTSGSRVKVFLPALNWDGANQLLGHYGFHCSPAEYQPHKAWEFVFANPQVPVWIEEAALKAMASCSIGQLAISVNGIYATGQKTRSDRLRKPLEMLAKDGRRMVVRFDSGKVSEKLAQMVCSQLERAGAQASWYAWLSAGPQKTDDYVAAKLRGLKAPAYFPLIAHQEALSVVGRRALAPYSRLRGKWNTLRIDREFEGSDIVEALRVSRIVALHGATGTRKTVASVEAIDQIEIESGRSHVVLGVYHRASLVHKGAYEFGVRDMSAPRGSVERDRGLHEGVVCRDGLFCCCESIKKQRGNEWDLWRWSHELLENPRPTILFLDEISQTMTTLLLDGTDSLTPVRAEAARALERILTNPCVMVIAAESGLGDAELNWLQDLTGCRPCVVSTSFKRERSIHVGPSTAENIRALQQLGVRALNQGHRFWCSMGKKSDLKDYIGPLVEHYGGAIVTSENSSEQTAADIMANTQVVAEKFRVFGFSPAITSGISVTFSVALSACVQQFAMSPEDALQAVDRSRNSAVRVLLFPISAPLAKIGSGEIFRDGVLKAKLTSATRGDQQAYLDFWTCLHKATAHYALELEVRNNYEVVFNDHVLKCRLIEQGYTLKNFDELIAQSPIIATLQQKVKDNKEEAQTLKQGLLHKLCLGQITIENAQQEARQAATGGLAVDYERVDPSEAWNWLQALGVPALVEAGSYHAGTAEFNFTADAVRSLDKQAARDLKRVLGGRTVIPGPEDEVKASFLNSLLKVAGFSPKESGQLRINGQRVRVYRLR